MDEVLLKLLATVTAFAAGWFGHVTYVKFWIARVHRRA